MTKNELPIENLEQKFSDYVHQTNIKLDKFAEFVQNIELQKKNTSMIENNPPIERIEQKFSDYICETNSKINKLREFIQQSEFEKKKYLLRKILFCKMINFLVII